MDCSLLVFIYRASIRSVTPLGVEHMTKRFGKASTDASIRSVTPLGVEHSGFPVVLGGKTYRSAL